MIDILVYIISNIISLYAFIMLLYCLFSWLIRDRSNGFFSVISVIAEPPLIPIKRFLWRFDFFRRSPIDFSPIILFLILRLVVSALAYLTVWF